MSIFYLDIDNGNDSTTTTPLGWWRANYTVGSGTQPSADSTVIGLTSSATAIITVTAAPTGGTWAGGDAAGWMYFYGKSGTFVSESVSGVAGTFTVTGDLQYCAWQTFGSGAITGRVVAGDTIRVAKSPDPVSIGSGTWVDQSATVTLQTAQNVLISLCDTAWTAVSGSTLTNSNRKIGTNSITFYPAVSMPTGSLFAYETITGGLDLSSYQKISFWLFFAAQAQTAGWYKICLCSDVSGATPVDEFIIPTSRCMAWHPLTLTKEGGGNLGSSISSIAIYTNTAAPISTSCYFRLDDIIACTTTGLNLRSMVSKSSAAGLTTEGWYGIMSICGTYVNLDNYVDTLTPTAAKGYSTNGTTPETVTTYIREAASGLYTLASNATDSNYMRTQVSGTENSPVSYIGGYNPQNNTKDGCTFVDGFGWGNLAYISNINIRIDNFSAVRFYYGLHFYINSTTATNFGASNCIYGLYFSSSSRRIIASSIYYLINGTYGIGTYALNSSAYFNDGAKISNNTNYACNVEYGNLAMVAEGTGYAYNQTNMYYSSRTVGDGSTFRNFRVKSNGGFSGVNNVYLYDCYLDCITEVGSTVYSNSRVYSHNHDWTPNNHWIWSDGAYMHSQSTVRHTEAGLAWKILPSSSYRNTAYPADFPIARVACSGNKQVTFTAYMKKDNATGVACQIRCPSGQEIGISATVTDVKSDDTNWEQLSISFTPTAAGVAQIYADAWYIGTSSACYIDDITISEAA